MNTLDEAAKRGCEIIREVRYFAKHPEGGPLYALQHDWTTEQFDREFVDEKLNAAREKSDKAYNKIYGKQS